MAEISFLLDEHVPLSVAEELRANEVEARTVYNENLEGYSDKEILAYADGNNLVVVTQDSTFLKRI